jgi:hypothetical protein
LIARKPRPSVRCTRCGQQNHEIEEAEKPCTMVYAGKQCDGEMRAHVARTDWAPCPNCDMTGATEGGTCPECRGHGWLFMR